MPHRTVFQLGRDHAHPFTMFVGGFVIGTLVTGTIAWAWAMAEDADIEVEDSAPAKRGAQTSTTAAPSPSLSPTASPQVTF